ncbi:PIN domain-containing protein [Nocardia carnea]|uniref:Ribonuclease VapC n=1 Tax=Nocardia carnea TaxID=37328 RepID=A0ABW7TN87_9NOCA|nr:PIN domain-containing protein [Nocardia carnea]
MIGYLLDTSALWHLFRNTGTAEQWREPVRVGAFRICEPTRAEFLFSAKGPAHRDALTDAVDELCVPTAVPKGVWRWVDAAQYKLTQQGQHRSAGVVDLVVCATAVHHGLTVLHTDNDFTTVSRVLPELREYDVRR